MEKITKQKMIVREEKKRYNESIKYTKTVLVCLLQKRRLFEKTKDLVPMQSVLYALAMKVLTAKEIAQVKEMMTMTILGQMIMEDGIEKGEFKNMQELVRDGILTIEAAASRKHMTVAEFQKKLIKLGLDPAE